MTNYTKQLKELRTQRRVMLEKIQFFEETLAKRELQVGAQSSLDETSRSRLEQYRIQAMAFREELPGIEAKIKALEPLSQAEPHFDTKELDADIVKLLKALLEVWSIASQLAQKHSGYELSSTLFAMALGVRREAALTMNKFIQAAPQLAEKAKLEKRYE